MNDILYKDIKNVRQALKIDFSFAVKYAMYSTMKKEHSKSHSSKKKSHYRGKHSGPRKKAGPKPIANIYGVHAVEEAMLNPERVIKDIYISEKMARQFEPILINARKKGLTRPEPKIIEKRELDRIGQNVVHQGIAIQAEALPEIQVQDLISLTYQDDNAMLLMLDQVTDPHNVGAILRSAAAFGVKGLIMQTRHAPQIDGILTKIACGGAEHVPVAFETNLSRALEALQGAGFQAIALDERGDDLADTKISAGKKILVLGSEGKGLRPKIQEQCDKLVRLPTQGIIQSLNVSNAAAVALYALKTASK